VKERFNERYKESSSARQRSGSQIIMLCEIESRAIRTRLAATDDLSELLDRVGNRLTKEAACAT
jgi:hypothetical protein